MRMLDLACQKCGAIKIDHLQRDTDTDLPRCHAMLEDHQDTQQRVICQGKLERVHLPTNRGTVIQDTIEGGVLLHHGLCNADGSPKRYYSKSEIAAEAKKRGMTNLVTHVGSKGSDKNRHTSKWV